MNIEKLIVKFFIEEDNKSLDKRIFYLATAKVNMVEHSPNLKGRVLNRIAKGQN